MPLTSERPGWSSINQEATTLTGHVVELALHGFIPHPTLAHVSLIKCSAAQAGLPGSYFPG